MKNEKTKEQSLTQAIKGITEKQAELLAGEFGQLRKKAIDQLKIAQGSIDNKNK